MLIFKDKLVELKNKRGDISHLICTPKFNLMKSAFCNLERFDRLPQFSI